MITTGKAHNKVSLDEGSDYREAEMRREDEIAVKITKEIVVKFIEVGRLSLSSFGEAWEQIHEKVKTSLSTFSTDEKPPANN